MKKIMIYPVESCRGCPLHETGKDCDKYTNWETVTVHRCWHKEMDGKTIPEEIGLDGYEEFPDWCPLEDKNEVLDEWDRQIKLCPYYRCLLKYNELRKGGQR